MTAQRSQKLYPTDEIKVPVWAEDELVVTGFISKFTTGYYPDTYDPCWGEGYRRQLTVDGQKCMFDLQEGLTCWHIPSKQRQWMFDQIVRTADATLVVFSVYEPEALERARSLVESFRRVRIENGLDAVPVAMIANTMVLQSRSKDEADGGGQRVVSVDEVQALKDAGYEVVAECDPKKDEQTVLEAIFADLGRAVQAQWRRRREVRRIPAPHIDISSRRSSWKRASTIVGKRLRIT